MRFIKLLIALIAISGCKPNTTFNVDGEIANADGKTIYLKEYTVEGNVLIDSLKIKKNGRFHFKAKTPYPAFYLISISDNQFITLLIEPKEKINIKIDAKDFTDYEVSGSAGSLLIKKLNQRLINTKNQLAELTDQYNKALGSENIEQITADLNEKYQKIINNQRDSSIAFIINNINSLACITALYQKVDETNFVLYKNRDIQYIKIVAESLEKLYPQSPFVKGLIADKENLLKKYNALKINKELSNLTKDSEISSIPEIRLPNIHGDTIALSSLKNKLILLSFWATWNKTSIQQNLAWKDLYEKYHDKGFEIYQVSLDTKKDIWEKTINFDQLPWINVSDLQGVNSLSARIYNVQEVPTTFIIRNGEIIQRNPSLDELKRRLSIAFD